jgi:hypothetical protein
MKKFIWGSQQEDAFQKMKSLLAQETILTYPEFDKPFVIYTNASECQIGSIVRKNEKQLGFFSKKLNETQQHYPVTEQELLAIVETLKYFKHMLLGQDIIVKTERKNLTHPNSTHTSDRVLRQRLLLEEYGMELQYIQGERNVVADVLLPLPTAKLFLLSEEEDFPLNLVLIVQHQLDDKKLQQALTSHQPGFKKIVRKVVELYVHSHQETIYVPASLRASLLQWYHLTLQHPSVQCMQATLRENFYWPGVDAAVEKIVRMCAICQKGKLTAVKKYGKIPLPASPHLTPWEEVHIDLISPWDVCYNSSAVPGKSTIEKIHALTAIDKATGWPEFTAILNKTSYHVAIQFNSTWLCPYPHPTKVIYDNGTEFVGQEFQELLCSYGIKDSDNYQKSKE